MITRHWHTCDDEGGAQHTRDRDTAPAWSVPAFSSPLWQPGRRLVGQGDPARPHVWHWPGHHLSCHWATGGTGPARTLGDQVPGGSSWVLTILETIARWSTGDIVKDPTDLTSTNPGIINTYIHIYTHISGPLDSSGFIYLINNEFVKFSIIGWIFILQCVELYLIWYNDILEYCNFMHMFKIKHLKI